MDHLPLAGIDDAPVRGHVHQLAQQGVARALGNALVAPVIAYVPEGNIDPPSGHMRYPGAITLPQEHYAKLLEYAARS